MIGCFLAILLMIGPGSVPATHDSLTPSASEGYSFGRPDEAVVKHLELDLKVDFKEKILSGKVSLFIQNKSQTDKLYLDTRALVIKRVTLGPHNERTTYRLGKPEAYLGQPLIVDIQPDTKIVNIWYQTSSGSDALQWLHPSQTAGKKDPFLYTQSEPIHARTWIPCQDDPSVRITYRAKIRVPRGMLALMSAENPKKKSSNGQYDFYMPRTIPSYLLALAVGDLDYEPIGDRCGVYADPAIVDTAAWEFADIDSMLTIAEQLYGPYRWQRYDVLVLPSAFPLGGMENPRLTFTTPTLLAGDRSLVSVVAHELGHSWAGNLVTNATWDDIWLNEGMATYIERRIVEAVYGREESEMEALLGLQVLKKDIMELSASNPDTRLRPDYAGRNLDDFTSDIPYEKGYLFFRTIEETVGRDKWDAFLRDYFDTFEFQSMTTRRFLSFLNEQLLDDDTSFASKVDVKAWVYNPGMPPSLPSIRFDVFASAESLAKAFIGGTWSVQPRPIRMSTPEMQQFLHSLPRVLTQRQMETLDGEFRFTTSRNSEILQEWFLHVIDSKDSLAYPSLENFLTRVGRLKYLDVIYRELARTVDGLALAKRIYAKARAGYHPITVHALDEILKWRN